MWYQLGKWILKNRITLLIALFIATAFMAFFASKVQLSYEFTRAIPTDNPRYQEYQSFKSRFGEDGSMLVIGVETKKFYQLETFNALKDLHKNLKNIKGVEDVLSIPEAVTLIKNDSTNKLVATKIFAAVINQQQLDTAKAAFENLPFYKGLLYNPETTAYLTGVTINKDVMSSKNRSVVIADILQAVKKFEKETNLEIRFSGLPYIRTTIGDLIKREMMWFLVGSLILSAITLILFFRSASAMLMSLTVVMIGVVWSLGSMVLLGYKITLLTALIPPLLVVIGIPNCIYFLNKYHATFRETGDKTKALETYGWPHGGSYIVLQYCSSYWFCCIWINKKCAIKRVWLGSRCKHHVSFLYFAHFHPTCT